MSQLALYLLGQPQLTKEGRPIELKSRKGLALLAYLAVSGPGANRDTLATFLWPEHDQTRARANLRRTLFTLNQTPIGAWLVADPETVTLEPDNDDCIDVLEFAAKLAAGEVDDLRQAAALYRGDFLSGLYLSDSQPFEEWATIQRERYRRQVLDALGTLTTHHLAGAEHAEAEAAARRQLEIDDLRESAWRGLMEALARDGRRNQALAEYERCRQLLQHELGVAPAAETTALYESIRSGELDAGTPPVSAAPALRGYVLQDVIGTGAFAVVYRARQPHVEREVAVKIILPQYANQPEFIRRFEAEAQLVAGLEHLHIVPLYDYWREPDGAYLVMRLMKGGSLEDALKRGPLELEATARLMDQVGSALAVAHQQGVVHRDIKPANILLDEEGHAYLSDFGIAKQLGGDRGGSTLAGAIVGSPGYLAPEQVRSERVSPQTDIYSLGVVLYELLVGQHPFPNTPTGELLIKQYSEPLPSLQTARRDLPAALDGVVQRATAKEAAARYPDVLAMVADVHQALRGAVPAEAWVPEPELPLHNPYKGLQAFLEADADDFFGREALTQRLVARLGKADGALSLGVPFVPPGDASRFLAVVGPSGSGKSSVVRAGLVPALRQGALPGSEEWFVVQMLPGTHPLEELELGLLRIASRPPQGLMEQLRRDARGILRAARLVMPEDGQLLLIIDQFEELFTLVDDPAERRHFMDSLFAAVTDPRGPVWVVITLRADFYDRPLLHPDFSILVQERTEVVVPLTVEELEGAIRGPAERVGALLETGLVTTIVADVHEQPGGLPLLQYALTELFERREGRALTSTAYQEIGGVLGALGRRAEEVYQGLEPGGQEAARQLFLRLVTLGEGTEDTRRRALRAELEALNTADRRLQTWDNRNPGTNRPGANGAAVGGRQSAVINYVIDTFGRARLLSFDRDPLTRGPTVEVAHEALLREWQRLREWLDKGRADVRMQRVLANTAAEWRTAERDPSFLLRGSRLDQFEGWAAETELALTPDERAFLDASSEERRRREQAQRAQQERELALERALVRRLRVIAGVLLAASVLGIILTLAVFRQSRVAQDEAQSRATQQAIAETERGRAEAEARLAAARELAAAAVSNLELDPERSILLALQAVNTTYAVDQSILPQAEAVLHQALLASHLRLNLTQEDWGSTTIYDVAFSPECVHLPWPAAPGSSLDGGPEPLALHASAGGCGALLVTGVGNNTAVIWDLETGQPVRTLSHPKKGAASVLENGVQSVAFSRDSTRLATAGADGEVKIWDTSASPNPGLSQDEGTGADSGQELTSLGRLSLLGFVHKVDLSPDGTRLATVSADGTPRVWDVNSGQELFSLIGHNGTVRDVAFSPDGALLATGDDATAQIWDAASGEKLRTLPGHSATVWSVAFSPECVPLSGGAESPAPDAQSPTVLADLGQGGGRLPGSADGCGSYLATASADRTARIWDITTGQEVLSLTGHADQVRDVAFSPDGTRLATAGADGTARIWILATGEESLSLAGHTDLISAVAFSPDGTRLATASADGTAKVWDITPDQELLSFSSGTVYDMALSPEGARLATSSARGTATVWDLTTGQALLTVSDQGHGQPLNVVEYGLDTHRLVPGVAFSPDGTLLATAGSRQAVKVWDLATGQDVVTLSPAGFVNAVAFSPECVRLPWPAAVGSPPLPSTPERQRSGDAEAEWCGGLLATSAEDSVVRIWDISSLWQAQDDAALNTGATRGEKLDELVGLHSGQVKDVVFSPDGSLLATAGTDGLAVIWDAATRWHLFKLSGHTGELTSVAFSADGGLLATASRDTTVKIWDVHSGEELLTLSGHNAAVNSVAFSRECVSSPDEEAEECGVRLASASADGTVRVWDVETGEELLSISTHPIGVGRVAFSRDGTRLITANWDNTVRVYLLSIEELIALARSRVTRGLTDEECQQYLHLEGCLE